MQSERKLPHNWIRQKWAFYHYLVFYHWLELTVLPFCLRTVGSLTFGIFQGSPDFESFVQVALLQTLVSVRPSHPDSWFWKSGSGGCALFFWGAGTSSLELLPSDNCRPPSKSQFQGSQALFQRRPEPIILSAEHQKGQLYALIWVRNAFHGGKHTFHMQILI